MSELFIFYHPRNHHNKFHLVTLLRRLRIAQQAHAYKQKISHFFRESDDGVSMNRPRVSRLTACFKMAASIAAQVDFADTNSYAQVLLTNRCKANKENENPVNDKRNFETNSNSNSNSNSQCAAANINVNNTNVCKNSSPAANVQVIVSAVCGRENEVVSSPAMPNGASADDSCADNSCGEVGKEDVAAATKLVDAPIPKVNAWTKAK
uniref:Uncharacterized protein n=1 Tax=Strigamia maritima TaxID=126957 RepID=T1JLD7_STRMM